MEVTNLFMLLIVCVIACIYKLLTKHNDVFKNRGVEYEKPTIFFGNMFYVFMGKMKETELFEYFYDKFSREKVFGVFVLNKPVFVVKDRELIKKILKTNFECFANCPGNNLDNALSNELFYKSLSSLENDEWKTGRKVLHEAFQNLPMKKMTETFLNCSKISLIHLKNQNEKKDKFVIETDEIFRKFIANSISVSIFGFQGSSCAEVHKIIKLIEEDFLQFEKSIKFLLASIAPNFLSVKVLREEVCRFFNDNISNVVSRQSVNNTSNAHNVLQAFVHEASKHSLHDEFVAAQIFTFFAGGFKATLHLLTMCFRELARNVDVQAQLVYEIESYTKTNNSKSFNCDLQSMRYLDMFVNETARKHPPMPLIIRICNKDCNLTTNEGEIFKFIKGDLIQIPLKLIQNDAKYFSYFEPSRFDDQNNYSNMLSYGYGQRKCLANHFTMLQVKAFIVTFLSEFSIENSNSSNVITKNEEKLIFVQRNCDTI